MTSAHSCQDKPVTINEKRRIVIAHIAEHDAVIRQASTARNQRRLRWSSREQARSRTR